MFIGRNKENALAQAKSNATRNGFNWYVFQDQYGAWRTESEAPRGKSFIVIEPDKYSDAEYARHNALYCGG